MTKTAFLAAYRAQLLNTYSWAQNTEKLDRFMASVERTIYGTRNEANLDGDAADDAWKAIGMKGVLSYKALRALPSE